MLGHGNFPTTQKSFLELSLVFLHLNNFDSCDDPLQYVDLATMLLGDSSMMMGSFRIAVYHAAVTFMDDYCVYSVCVFHCVPFIHYITESMARPVA